MRPLTKLIYNEQTIKVCKRNLPHAPWTNHNSDKESLRHRKLSNEIMKRNGRAQFLALWIPVKDKGPVPVRGRYIRRPLKETVK